MTTRTLEQYAPEQSLSPLASENKVGLDPRDLIPGPDAPQVITPPDLKLDFSSGQGFFDTAPLKDKDKASELLSNGPGFFDMQDSSAVTSWKTLYDAGEALHDISGETRTHRLRTVEGRRELGRSFCRWAGTGPLSAEELEKARAREEVRRTTIVDEQDLLGTKVNELVTLIPEKLREKSRTAVLATTLVATILAGNGALSSPEKSAELHLTAENLPELIFSHEHIKVEASANKVVQRLLEYATAGKALAPAQESATPQVSLAKPQLLETIVKIADDGNEVTLSSVAPPEIETPAEAPDFAASLGINIKFNSESAPDAVIQLVEQEQEQLNLSILSANETGIFLVANTSETDARLVPEIVPPVAPAEVEAPVGPLDNVNLEAIENINGTDKKLIREVVAYLIAEQGFTPQGAAYLTGNLNKESNLNQNAPGGGLAQLQGVRALGMPSDLKDQLEFLVNVEMDRDGGAPHLNELLRDPDGSVEAIKQGLKDWERWGIEGDRFAYGAQILEAIQTPMVEADPRLAHELIDQDSQKEIEGIATVEVKDIRVNIDMALNLANMLQAADADGVNFTGSGIRTTARQAELRVINGCPNVYKAPASSCDVPTAIPGRSMHETGLAVDFSHDGALIRSRRNDGFQWLEANAERFGLYNLPSEPWHWSINGK